MQQQNPNRRKTTRKIHKPAEHAGDGEIMQVGAEAMIEEASPAAGDNERMPVDERMENIPSGGVEFRAEDLGEEPESAPESTPEPAPKPELEILREERDSFLDLARRERADFDNYRKRVQKEMAEMKRASLGAFLRDFFGPLDDMDRVLRESEKSHSFESLVQGVRIMEENFWRALAKAGVKKIDARGKPFDPNLHEAMAVVPMADVPPNTIVEVYENGYKLDDFILRAARVIVSRAPDE
jgi:molecular chaperone GrpE